MVFNKPSKAHANGIEIEYFEQGSGPAVLLLHGFPELPFSWRHVVGPVADAGFRVIVPSQRGYGGTDAPEGPDSYNLKNLVADMTGLLDALHVESAVWFGHDAGSLPAWYSALYAPDRVLGMGAMGLPYASMQGDLDVVQAYDAFHGPKNYIRAFQEPGAAEQVLERDVEHTFRSILRGRGCTMAEFEAAPAEVRELPIGVWVGSPQLFGEPIVDETELRHYVETFERTGFTGGLNWYRALPQDHAESRGLDYLVDLPALMINAGDDWFFPRGAADGMHALLPQLEMHDIPDAGHWLQQEKPDEVNAILTGWLRRNFSA